MAQMTVHHRQSAVKRAIRQAVGPDVHITNETVEALMDDLRDQGYEIVREAHALPMLKDYPLDLEGSDE